MDLKSGGEDFGGDQYSVVGDHLSIKLAGVETCCKCKKIGPENFTSDRFLDAYVCDECGYRYLDLKKEFDRQFLDPWHHCAFEDSTCFRHPGYDRLILDRRGEMPIQVEFCPFCGNK